MYVNTTTPDHIPMSVIFGYSLDNVEFGTRALPIRLPFFIIIRTYGKKTLKIFLRSQALVLNTQDSKTDILIAPTLWYVQIVGFIHNNVPGAYLSQLFTRKG